MVVVFDENLWDGLMYELFDMAYNGETNSMTEGQFLHVRELWQSEKERAVCERNRKCHLLLMHRSRGELNAINPGRQEISMTRTKCCCKRSEMRENSLQQTQHRER